MEFKDLEYIVAVAEEQNLSRAAERLIVTQPTLSKTVARLEKAAGCPLFVRTQHGLVLTENGERFIDISKTLLRLKDELDEELRGIAQGVAGRIRLGISYTFSGSLVPKVLPIFSQLHPGVEVAIHTETSSLLQRLLLDGDIDVAVLVETERHRDLLYEVLFYEQILLAASEENDVTRLGEIVPGEDYPYLAPSALAGQRYILSHEKMRLRQSADQFFRDEGIVPDIAVTTASTTTAIHLASQNVGLAFVPSTLAGEHSEPPVPKYFHTAPTLADWKVVIAIGKKHRRSKLLNNFLQVFKNAM
ncbi:MAG: LysR family transcriptional regulator [Planctomycetes bacterium]|nr:LysR family transcriptional regulator [Planctomycetota bacterium]